VDGDGKDGTCTCFQEAPSQCTICASVGLAVPTAQALVDEITFTPVSCPVSVSCGFGGTGMGTEICFQAEPFQW
jgi:hypothetical protein